jgi:hypothetical protein
MPRAATALASCVSAGSPERGPETDQINALTGKGRAKREEGSSMLHPGLRTSNHVDAKLLMYYVSPHPHRKPQNQTKNRSGHTCITTNTTTKMIKPIHVDITPYTPMCLPQKNIVAASSTLL